jgi:hypothetical protein
MIDRQVSKTQKGHPFGWPFLVNILRAISAS